MSLLSIGGDGPGPYMGNPALQKMLLEAAMRRGSSPGSNQSSPAPLTQDAAISTGPTGDIGGGLFFRGPDASQPQQAQPPAQPKLAYPTSPMGQMPASGVSGDAPPQPRLATPAPGQLSAAIGALNGSPRVTPPGMQPVMVDGSQPLHPSQDPGLAQIAGQMPDIKPAHHGIDWRMLAGIVGDGLLGAAGQPGVYGPWKREQAKQQSEQQFELAKALMQNKLPKTVGNSLVQQGEDGQYHSVYSDPEPFESFATAQGYTPGTPEYAQAVKNYRLGAWSSDAVGAKEDLAGNRFGYQSELQDARLANSRRNTDVRVGATMRGQDFSHHDRQRGQDFSHQDRQRGQNMHAATTQHGQDLTDSRVRGSATYQGRGGRGRGGGGAAVAVGPNGHQIVVQNGRWVDAQTGQPVQ